LKDYDRAGVELTLLNADTHMKSTQLNGKVCRMLTSKEPADAAKSQKTGRGPLIAKPRKQRVDVDAMCDEVKARYPNVLAQLAK